MLGVAWWSLAVAQGLEVREVPGGFEVYLDTGDRRLRRADALDLAAWRSDTEARERILAALRERRRRHFRPVWVASAVSAGALAVFGVTYAAGVHEELNAGEPTLLYGVSYVHLGIAGASGLYAVARTATYGFAKRDALRPSKFWTVDEVRDWQGAQLIELDVGLSPNGLVLAGRF